MKKILRALLVATVCFVSQAAVAEGIYGDSKKVGNIYGGESDVSNPYGDVGSSREERRAAIENENKRTNEARIKSLKKGSKKNGEDQGDEIDGEDLVEGDSVELEDGAENEGGVSPYGNVTGDVLAPEKKTTSAPSNVIGDYLQKTSE